MRVLFTGTLCYAEYVKRMTTKSAKETIRLSGEIISRAKTIKTRGATVIGFSGELGAGKTTLIQGIGKALGVREKIQSPTFVILKTYPIAKRGAPWRAMVHIDAYRLEHAKDALPLGLSRMLKEKENLFCIEWPEKIKSFLPKTMLWVELRHTGKNHRHIIIKNPKYETRNAKPRFR